MAFIVALLTTLAVFPGTAQAACRQDPVPGPSLPKTAPRDPMLDRLGLERVWEISTGAGVTVAVIDSGVDGRHPKLSGAMLPGVELSPVGDPRGFTTAPSSMEDCENHGTSVAALIAGSDADDDRVIGVAPGAKIVPIRFTVPFQQATDAMVAEAIRLGAERAQVLNLSFALPVDKPVIKDAVAAAIARGAVVVAAAGNEQQDQPGVTWYPAAYDGVLAVAAVDERGQPLKESNQGQWIDVAAPGKELTTASSGGRGYVAVSGTSFATALASGVAALVRSKYPDMPVTEVVRRITATATPVAGQRTDRIGAGVIDPFAALTAAIPARVPSTAAGSVEIVPLPPENTGPAGVLLTALSWAGGITVAAVVAALGGIAVRRGLRRGWRPGPAEQREDAPPPPRAADVELT
ncbi:type VII secretion-associated serine protease mycosin [Kibdelosporangium philippinense]|uniref:Type VII secretion-associated serine protease mycosin n=1 Tax=Kibdelosporangium philippinense TaxID=211113 RepID=A0ABS8Z0W3_9PSEU|nr:type VII secretion-associated serine protease mycosin [Kibdelosporangium philippinense]MCE7001598.1 type VII secretion-associated serine protease mycosin [Kibdelosporangium philippinense]